MHRCQEWSFTGWHQRWKEFIKLSLDPKYTDQVESMREWTFKWGQGLKRAQEFPEANSPLFLLSSTCPNWKTTAKVKQDGRDLGGQDLERLLGLPQRLLSLSCQDPFFFNRCFNSATKPLLSLLMVQTANGKYHGVSKTSLKTSAWAFSYFNRKDT